MLVESAAILEPETGLDSVTKRTEWDLRDASGRTVKDVFIEFGFKIEELDSKYRLINDKLVSWATYIYCVDDIVYEFLNKTYPLSKNKFFLLGKFEDPDNKAEGKFVTPASIEKTLQSIKDFCCENLEHIVSKPEYFKEREVKNHEALELLNRGLH